MNEHAKSILRALAEGKTIEHNYNYTDDWYKATIFNLADLDRNPDNYRIKPEDPIPPAPTQEQLDAFMVEYRLKGGSGYPGIVTFVPTGEYRPAKPTDPNNYSQKDWFWHHSTEDILHNPVSQDVKYHILRPISFPDKPDLKGIVGPNGRQVEYTGECRKISDTTRTNDLFLTQGGGVSKEITGRVIALNFHAGFRWILREIEPKYIPHTVATFPKYAWFKVKENTGTLLLFRITAVSTTGIRVLSTSGSVDLDFQYALDNWLTEDGKPVGQRV